VAYVSHDGGSSWIDVTGNIATVSDNARLQKLIGFPGQDYLLYLATTKGVFRSDDRGRHWTDYSNGLRLHEQVDDIVIGYDGAINLGLDVNLYVVTRGRGFWRRRAD
jgi:hypothetical protein